MIQLRGVSRKRNFVLGGIITIISLATLLFAFVNVHPVHAFSNGDGSSGAPYWVGDCNDLQAIKDDLDAHYIIVNEIDCTDTATWNGGKGFDPIGNDGAPFTGMLDGYNRPIEGLTINRADDTLGDAGGSVDEHDVGLFGRTDGASINRIKLVHAKVKGYENVGGVVGYALNTSINQASVNETAASTQKSCNSGEYCIWARYGTYGGGLVGYMNGGSIEQGHTGGPVKGSGNVIGGLVGHMDGAATLTNSTSYSNVDGGSYIGGAVGLIDHSSVSVSDVYASGDVLATTNDEDGKSGIYAGGFVGSIDSAATIQKSHATGNVHADTGAVGGFAGGSNSGHISDSYATGDVSTDGYLAGGFAGGLEGGQYYTLYASGDVSANVGSVGGFAGGVNLFSGDSLTYSFAVGHVSTVLGEKAGFATNYSNSAGTSNQNYFNSTSAGTTDCAVDPSGDPVNAGDGCITKTSMSYFYDENNRPFTYNAVYVYVPSTWYMSGSDLPEHLGSLPHPILAKPLANKAVKTVPIRVTIPHDPVSGTSKLIFTSDERTVTLTLDDFGTNTYGFDIDPTDLSATSQIASVSPAGNTIPDGTYRVQYQYEPNSGSGLQGDTVYNVRIASEPYIVCEAPSSTNTTISLHCYAEPDEFGDTTWQARYFVAGTTDYRSVSLEDAHEGQVNITGLTPGTDYRVQLRFTNDWGTSPWGTVVTETTGTAPSSSGSGAEAGQGANVAESTDTPSIRDEDEMATPTTGTENTNNGAPITTSSPNNSLFSWLWIIPGVIVLVIIIAYVTYGRLKTS